MAAIGTLGALRRDEGADGDRLLSAVPRRCGGVGLDALATTREPRSRSRSRDVGRAGPSERGGRPRGTHLPNPGHELGGRASCSRTKRVPWAPPAPDPEATAALRAVARRERPDIVHGHDWLARSFLPLKRRNGPAFVMSLHYFTLSCPKKNLMYDHSPCAGPRLGKCLSCAGRHYGRAKGTAVTLAHRLSARAEASLVDLFIPVSAATATGNALDAAALPFVVVPNFVADAAPPPDAARPHAVASRRTVLPLRRRRPQATRARTCCSRRTDA